MWEAEFRRVAEIAASQHGFVTEAQGARLVGRAAMAHLRDQGLLRPAGWDVLELVGSPTPPRASYPYTAWLALTSGLDGVRTVLDAVISHHTAAWMHGFGVRFGADVDITVPRRVGEMPGVRQHVDQLSDTDVTLRHRASVDTPVTTVLRTVSDLARDGDTTPAELRRVISEAVRLDLVDLFELYQRLASLEDDVPTPCEWLAQHGLESLWDDRDDDRDWPALHVDALSPRNRRAYALMAAPDDVAGARRLLVAVAVAVAAKRLVAPDRAMAAGELDALLRELAAELVAGLRSAPATSTAEVPDQPADRLYARMPDFATLSEAEQVAWAAEFAQRLKRLDERPGPEG